LQLETSATTRSPPFALTQAWIVVVAVFVTAFVA
jgi:hypothetical protein